ncbi:MAG: patatin-like phospholipase family protein [Anaerolineae bacterium]|nr:patatin-like phospholipase family protein [Anaerolineae bacterium]
MMKRSIPVPRLTVAKSLAPEPGKTALVLAGGGIAGGVYELGALRALDEILLNRTVNDFDIYVGTSAGALIAAGLANGLSPQRLFEAVNGDHPEIAPVMGRDLLSFDRRGLLGRTASWPRQLFEAGRHYWSNADDLSLLDLFWSVLGMMPAALYNSDSLEKYVRQLFTEVGGTNEFTHLLPELDLIATDLQSSERAIFNREETPDVPVSQAVAASSAVPLLYRPVHIGGRRYVDGAVRGNASVDLAVERGASLVVCINPLAPEAQHADKVVEEPHNMQAVVNQVFRTIFHANLHYHIKHLARLHPEVDFVVVEPAEDDLVMSQQNIMRYSPRQNVFEHAYQSVSLHLALNHGIYSSMLAHHNIPVAPRLSAESLEGLAAHDYDKGVLQQELARQQSLSYRSGGSSMVSSLARRLGELELAVEQLRPAS